MLTSTLSFVDLAGSERCPEASAPARVKEGAYINKSLHALALVVSKLSAGARRRRPRRNGRFPPSGRRHAFMHSFVAPT